MYTKQYRRIRSFRHSGLLGDIIYSLPAVRTVGGGEYFIDHLKENLPGKHAPLGEEKARLLLPLLESQPYIWKASLYNGERIGYDFDNFRLNQRRINQQHLAITHWQSIRGRGKLNLLDPWLFVSPKPVAELVISRSRKHYGNMNWSALLPFISKCVYVGIENEYKSFLKETGLQVGFYKVQDFLELAQVIAGSTCFVGNQSLGWAIAEGLKITRFLEVDDKSPNCLPQSKNGFVNINENTLRSLTSFLE